MAIVIMTIYFMKFQRVLEISNKPQKEREERKLLVGKVASLTGRFTSLFLATLLFVLFRAFLHTLLRRPKSYKNSNSSIKQSTYGTNRYETLSLSEDDEASRLIDI